MGVEISNYNGGFMYFSLQIWWILPHICLGVSGFFFLTFILLGVLWDSWICVVVSNINFEKLLSHYCFKHFFCNSFVPFSLSSPCGISIKCMLHLLWLQFLDTLYCFILYCIVFNLFSLCSWGLEVSTEISSSLNILSWIVFSLLMSSSKIFFFI